MTECKVHPQWSASGVGVCRGSLSAWRAIARQRAFALPEYDGDIERNLWIIGSATWLLVPLRALVVLTRDDTVARGWWKNIDYAKCLHLSISFRDPANTQSIAFDKRAARAIVRETFGGAEKLTWWEPAYTPEGRDRGVQHWRLFHTPDWATPIHPRGEPHTLNVPPGWSQWTEYQEAQPTPNFAADITEELPKRRA